MKAMDAASFSAHLHEKPAMPHSIAGFVFNEPLIG
jgi:hypothetical protein